MKSILWAIAIQLAFPCAAFSVGLKYQPLQLKNNYSNPEQVVQYYCGRDASGFVWTGFLDVERREFTVWEQVPQHEAFLVATQYEIKKVKETANRAIVRVLYNLDGMADAHQTRMPASEDRRTVEFHLRKVDGKWKIFEPLPQNLPPVILKGQFPLVMPQ